MNTFSTDTLLFSKWTRETLFEQADRHFLVISCHKDERGELDRVTVQDINTLQEQELDWHELEDPTRWHMGWH
ncbi:TIGR02450 family Trp-rich protein [Aeromonas bivalvium]|uniref:TIGR02450 family Trp-rich protein n=1 Tax=Aeromonas bivalvium TaxID=440079 RepID=A0ABW9GMH3_9GAMM|nr:TIGR02450 family Trp-rich protein [Aeromonas bivalvium]